MMGCSNFHFTERQKVNNLKSSLPLAETVLSKIQNTQFCTSEFHKTGSSDGKYQYGKTQTYTFPYRKLLQTYEWITRYELILKHLRNLGERKTSCNH